MSHNPPAQAPQATPYELIGGEATVRALVRRFYELMDTLPEAYAVRKLHATDLAGSEEKLFMYLSGWLGGPDLYVQRNGHPRLRARHLPFAIGTVERDQWLACMAQAMLETGVDPALRVKLQNGFFETADWMRTLEG